MTRANINQLKHTPWFAKAGAACSIVPIARFVGPSIFALKGGGYGCLFSLKGRDEESLTDLELESQVRSIESALRGLPEGSCLYQYTRVMSGLLCVRFVTSAQLVWTPLRPACSPRRPPRTDLQSAASLVLARQLLLRAM